MYHGGEPLCDIRMTTTNKLLTEDLNILYEKAEKRSQDSLKILTQSGFVLDTAEWLTVANYAKKYGVTQQVVVNWINRGVVPADCIKTLPEINNIRMIKDQPYKA